MKHKSLVRFSVTTALVTLGLLAAGGARAQAAGRYTVHEWGTFTSVQGGDGKLLDWRPLQSSALPGFVHNWNRPGLNVVPTTVPLGGKVAMVTLQRMETPVVYFYSDKILQADLSVGFPPGAVTEWYPQATQIGPSLASAGTNASPAPPDASLRESRVAWSHLTLTPPGQAGSELAGRLPADTQGSHYFAARVKGADYVQTDATGQPGGTNETEKFLFYRGAGSFKTPLQVSVDAQQRTVVANTGTEKLAHLLVMRVKAGEGAFAQVADLAGGKTRTLADGDNGWKRFPLARFQTEIGARMEAALVAEGLFAPEAKAMVQTWRDSWFTEEGTRVLYILPRSWTDGILPMTLDPRPDELVRVMVGRAEVITPEVSTQLLENLTRAQGGDAAARQQAGLAVQKLGRFAWPALTLALGQGNTNAVAELGYQLMLQAGQE
jgi:hypothetical protein